MSGGTVLTERFDVEPEFDPPDLRPVVGHTMRLPEQQIRTTYFDTVGMRLWDLGLILRYRQTIAEGDLPPEEGTGKWLLELPDPEPSDRTLSWPGSVDAIPADARRILAGVVRRLPLGPVAELSIDRRRLLLHEGEADRPWAEIDDDLVTVTAGPETGRRFRQLELEVMGAAATDAVTAELRSAGAAPAKRPKLAVALGLPDSAGRARAEGGSVAGAVKAVIGGGLNSLLREDFGLRLRLERGAAAEKTVAKNSVDGVHDARVATRRLRSNIRALSSVLDPVWTGHMADDLKWFGEALGQVRDLDVITECMKRTSEPGDEDGLEALLHLAAAERRVAARELMEVMEDRRYFDLLDRLHAAAERPPLEGSPGLKADDLLRQTIAGRYKKLNKRAARLEGHPDDVSLHRLRISVRRVRYAAKAGGDVLGKPARRTARRAKRLQTVLGDVHDGAMTAEWLQQQSSRPSITPVTALVAGRLSARMRQAAAELRPAWRKELRRLTATKGAGKKVARAWRG